MTTERYEGWTNYATYCVFNIGIDNDRKVQAYWHGQRDMLWIAAVDRPKFMSRSEQARLTLGLALKESFGGNSPLSDSNDIYSMLLSTALQEVDYREIADRLLTDMEDAAYEGLPEVAETE